MKFSEMPYERPDMSALKEQFAALTERLQNAPDYAAARAAFFAERSVRRSSGRKVKLRRVEEGGSSR